VLNDNSKLNKVFPTLNTGQGHLPRVDPGDLRFLPPPAFSIMTLWPTLTLWHTRGADYNGFYALQQYDEDVYADTLTHNS
jgi:hypothetical protein